MTDRAVSYEHLLRLAHQRALDGKGGLAASVAKLCLDQRSDLSDRELTLTFEIIRMLIDKVEVAVRRNIADYLGPRDDVPKDLIAFLANDTVHVAYPILRESPLLDDLDLMRLIDGHGTGHALAVATRAELSPAVSGKLIQLDDETVDVQLARNLTAHIAPNDLDVLVDRAVDRTGLRAPLAHRSDLGDDLARRLYTMVGDALRKHITEHYDIDSAAVSDAVDNAVLEGLDDPNPLSKALAGGWADAPQEATPAARLLSKAVRGDLEGMAVIFAERTRLPLPTARWVFERADGQTLAVALKAVGVDTYAYVSILTELKKAEDGDELNRLEAYFDRIDAKTSAMVVNHWKTRPPVFDDDL
jgi:hypothetical protein